jgi:hypothetical protein
MTAPKSKRYSNLDPVIWEGHVAYQSWVSRRDALRAVYVTHGHSAEAAEQLADEYCARHDPDPGDPLVDVEPDN